MNRNIIRIHAQDNVAVAIVPISAGEPLVGVGLEGPPAITDIPRHHKVALADISPAEPIVKYGEAIARARTAIKPGEWVHTHNILA